MCDPMPDEPLYADAFALTPDKKRILLLRKRDNGKVNRYFITLGNLPRNKKAHIPYIFTTGLLMNWMFLLGGGGGC